MKRLIGLVLMAATALAFAILQSVDVEASVDDFSFSQFEAHYYLEKDEVGRSSMRVDEKLVAKFPDFNQNKGIIRVIPLFYDGHPVSLSFDDSSLRRNSVPEPVYEKSKENGNLLVSTGTEGYVTGTQVYEFTYSMRDVVKDFDDHQELYWDSNGTEWRQSFGEVIAYVHLDSSIVPDWTGETACYQGYAGSDETCSVVAGEDGRDAVITFQSTRPLLVGENLTFVLGFKQGTFLPYQPGLGQIIVLGLRVLVTVAAIVAAIWAVILKLTKGRSAKGRGTVVPEYLPPKGISVLQMSELSNEHSTKQIAAQIIDLAVRHNIKIVEYDKKQTLFGSKKAYRLQFASDYGLNEDERKFLEIVFGTLTSGAEFDMGDLIQVRIMSTKLAVLNQSIAKASIERGYRYKILKRWIPIVIVFLSLIAAFTITVIIHELLGQFDGWSIASIATTGLATVIVMALIGGKLPLTEEGVRLRDYLKGLKMYIQIAEKERLAMLQSVEGAARQEVGDTSDRAQLVKLYERVLPYAVLLGQEKTWGKVLEQYYDNDTIPTWYIGTSVFNATTFSSSLQSFSSSTSSSSSGLGGGGSSGGGGGGGGGGGR